MGHGPYKAGPFAALTFEQLVACYPNAERALAAFRAATHHWRDHYGVTVPGQVSDQKLLKQLKAIAPEKVEAFLRKAR